MPTTSPVARAKDRPRAEDKVPPDTCRFCGLVGCHRDRRQCIDALRSALADLEFQVNIQRAR